MAWLTHNGSQLGNVILVILVCRVQELNEIDPVFLSFQKFLIR